MAEFNRDDYPLRKRRISGGAPVQVLFDSSEHWAEADPILGKGEPGYEEDTKIFKIGDGVTAWSELEPPAGSGGGGGSLIPLETRVPDYAVYSKPAASNILVASEVLGTPTLFTENLNGDWEFSGPAGLYKITFIAQVTTPAEPSTSIIEWKFSDEDQTSNSDLYSLPLSITADDVTNGGSIFQSVPFLTTLWPGRCALRSSATALEPYECLFFYVVTPLFA